jgi:DNA-binding CsgD family transcriptional regulator
MIQLNDSGFLQHEATPCDTLNGADLDSFRRWITRRNSARQQIRRLSPRELQVVILVADGLANKSIALRLEISVKTIEKHRANAARKLGVGSTAEMVRLAVESDHERSNAEPPQPRDAKHSGSPMAQTFSDSPSPSQQVGPPGRDVSVSRKY